MKERNHTFDFLCGICIIRMVTLHTIGMCGHGGDKWWMTIMSWSFFFMCFFFFKAGYFNKTISGNTKEFIKKKSKQLLIPYVVWGLIGFLHYSFYIPFEIERYHHTVEKMEWSHVWMLSNVYGNSPLWFLFSFWAAYVLVHLIKKIHIVKPISVFQTVIVLACPFISYWLFTKGNPLPMSLSNVFMGIFFFNMGRTWRWVLERLPRMHAMLISSVLIIIFCVLNILWHGEYTMSSNTFDGEPMAAFFNTMIILLGLSGILLKLPMKRVPVINYIGQHSMVYFVTHYIIIEFYRFVHIIWGRSIYGRYDDLIIMLVFTFCICTWLVPYVEQVPWLSGRFKTKNVVENNVVVNS